MNSAARSLSKVIVEQAMSFVDRDPERNFPKLLALAEKVVRSPHHKEAIENARRVWKDPQNNWSVLIRRLMSELHPNVRRKVLLNFFANAGLVGVPLEQEMAEKHQCAIPWAILMDPTAACNLNCTGCWAAEYDKKDSLDLDVMDRIIREGKELGVYMFIYSGGEPLIRRDDLITLAERHSDCMFLAFTNATLVDEDFAQDLVRVGNFALAISVEGFEAENDLRRGQGTFARIMRAMDILREHGIAFGFSACYHRKNSDVVGSDEFVDFMIEKGCCFGWYFTYIPLGKDAVPELLATPEQREYMYRKVREQREKKPIFLIDFWNDGEFAGGCIAGGRRYFHINARGDIEPCAFIHYSNMNIKEHSVLKALKSPLFREYQKRQPFNSNMLRPCPLLDNPEQLREMVHVSGAYSTQPGDEEAVDDLCAKCVDISKRWAVKADELWAVSSNGRQHLDAVVEDK